MTTTTDVCPGTIDSQCDVERPSRCGSQPTMQRYPDGGDRPSTDSYELHTCERLVVVFIQLKNYLGLYWLAPWFFVYIYPSILVYESHGFAGPFVYCNIVQILFFIVFEFWDESFNWTPLHDTIRSYSLQILGHQHITKSVDELILFCTWVFSWAAVPTICFINGHIFKLPSSLLERSTSHLSMMFVTYVVAYILILLWIDINLLEVKPHVYKSDESSNTLLSKSELIDNSIEPDEIPDLETVYEDISITNEFKIDNNLIKLIEALNENVDENEEPCKHMQVEKGEEAKEEDMDVISLSSSTLSDFDVITDEEINLLK